MWFSSDPCDLSFCDTSRFQLHAEVTLACDEARAFELISSTRDLPTWLKDGVSCDWTSPAPHGVGSTRDVKLKMMTVRERFLAWDPKGRLSFEIYATSMPIARRMLEDLRLQALGPKETHLSWTIHYEPRAWIRPFHPILRFVFGRLMTTSVANLARLVSASS